MPLPLLLGIGSVLLGGAGVAGYVDGRDKIKKAEEKVEKAKKRHEANIEGLNKANVNTVDALDSLGKYEMEVMQGFSEFVDVFERIKNRPKPKEYLQDDITLPKYNGEELRKISIGAGELLKGGVVGALGSAAMYGATYSAVMAFGTASTGTAISSLAGVAARNAALAALGGGSLAAGGGGMALGATLLNAASLGVGVLFLGIHKSMKGDEAEKKAKEIWSEMEKAEEKINGSTRRLNELKTAANRYQESIYTVHNVYSGYFSNLKRVVLELGHTDYNAYTKREKLITDNILHLVSLLSHMCRVELALKKKDENGIPFVNKEAVQKSIEFANTRLVEMNTVSIIE